MKYLIAFAPLVIFVLIALAMWKRRIRRRRPTETIINVRGMSREDISRLQ